MNRFTLGQNIKRYRNFNGIKQQILAKQIAVSRRTLSRYENGQCQIPAEKLMDIARHLNVSVNELSKLAAGGGYFYSIK
jgi:transcriptional regulator with XRE-family HTH domain